MTAGRSETFLAGRPGRRVAQFLAFATLIATLGAGGPVEAPVADAAERSDLEAVRALLRQGADVNTAQSDGMTALHWAAANNDVEIAVDGSACALSGSGPWECGFTMVSGTDHEIRIDIESDDYDLGYYFEVTAASSGVPSGGSNKDGC